MPAILDPRIRHPAVLIGGSPVDAAVLFDFGGTLDADGMPWKERFHRLYGAEGLDVPAARFAPVFYACDDALVGAVPATLSLSDVVHTLSLSLARALGCDPSVGDRVAARFLHDARAALEASGALLRRLAARYRLGIVSNFYGNLEAVCAEAGFANALGVVVDSACVGCEKPDPRIFHRATEALGVAPAAATFVGDSLARDMAGARAAGMPHVWLRGEPPLPGAPCCAGDRVMRRLSELETLLG